MADEKNIYANVNISLYYTLKKRKEIVTQTKPDNRKTYTTQK